MLISMLSLNHDAPILNIISAAFSYDSAHNIKLHTEAYFTISAHGSYITYLGTLVADHSTQNAGYITISLTESHHLIPAGSLISFPTADIALIALRKN